MPFGYRGPTIDHSVLSPNGRVSKSARAAALKREAARLFDGVDLNPPVPQPSERTRLLRHAAELRALADRGMRPGYHRKRAEIAEEEARRIQGSKP